MVGETESPPAATASVTISSSNGTRPLAFAIRHPAILPLHRRSQPVSTKNTTEDACAFGLVGK
jgi:hypothetical protein